MVLIFTNKLLSLLKVINIILIILIVGIAFLFNKILKLPSGNLFSKKTLNFIFKSIITFSRYRGWII